ncbi:MAG TPA: CBS domain-containing protein, partial [Labilithrix sp.]
SAPAMKPVREIMNTKLLYIREGDRISLARKQIVDFGVTAIPVLDETHRPVGMVSLRDLERGGEHVEPNGSVVTVRAGDPIDAGARLLAESPYHHLVVVDDVGVAVGIVSSVDFLRAILEMPPQHPAAFDGY